VTFVFDTEKVLVAWKGRGGYGYFIFSSSLTSLQSSNLGSFVVIMSCAWGFSNGSNWKPLLVVSMVEGSEVRSLTQKSEIPLISV